MSCISRDQKFLLISKFKQHETDTGSPEIQIAILSEKISNLTSHLKFHKKDHHSRRGLLIMVSRRRKLLDYLKRGKINSYKHVIGELGIRK